MCNVFGVRRSHSDVHILNWLAPSIDDWGPVRSHADFKTDFDARHKRKHAFWAKVNPPS